jgi:hypothetical protein
MVVRFVRPAAVNTKTLVPAIGVTMKTPHLPPLPGSVSPRIQDIEAGIPRFGVKTAATAGRLRALLLDLIGKADFRKAGLFRLLQ